MRGQLTEKADVFSYGIVVLELVSGRANLDLQVQPHASYLLDWVRIFSSHAYNTPPRMMFQYLMPFINQIPSYTD